MSETPLFRRPGRPLTQSSHLDRHSRGSFRFKVTIPQAPPFSGIRVTIPLHTHDMEQAAVRARIVRDTLRKCGILPFSGEIEAGDNYETGDPTDPESPCNP
jgi:hypothetical protein